MNRLLISSLIVLLCGFTNPTVKIGPNVIDIKAVTFVQVLGDKPHRVMKVGIQGSSNALIINEDDLKPGEFDTSLVGLGYK